MNLRGVTARALLLGGLMMAAACMDVAGPHAARRVSLDLRPVFDVRSGGGAGDADSFVIIITNPPYPTDTIARRIAPGQDTIQLTVQAEVTSSGVDTIAIGFDGFSSVSGLLLYAGSATVQVIAGAPTQTTPIAATYVGPGARIKTLALSPHAVAFSIGNSVQFAIAATDSSDSTMSADSVPVVFITRDVNVVAVNGSGFAQALANGQTWIVAQSVAHGSIRDSAQVTVAAAAPPTIALGSLGASFTDTAGAAPPPDQAIAVTNSGGGTLNGLAVGTITYGAGGSGWLTASLNASSAPATLTLHVTPGSLAQGTYTATVPVTASAASNSPQNVTVTLTVVGLPVISLSTASLTFTDTIGLPSPADQQVTVTNSGTGTLNNLVLGAPAYGSGSGWLSGTLAASTAPTTATIHVNPSGLAAGHYTATLPVQSTTATNSPQTISVAFDVVNPPLGSITITPGWFVMLPTGGQSLVVSARATNGATIATPALTWTSRNPAVATVDAGGSVTGVAGGTAVIVADAGGGIADSALVAVAGSGQAVASAVPDARVFDRVKAGDTVRVMVAVDLRGVAGGNVGSYTAEVDWNASQLTFVSADTVSGGFASPTVNTTNAGAGQLKFGGANPNGYATQTVALLSIKFVAASAGGTPVSLLLTDLTEAGTFTNLLTQAIIVSSAVAVQ